MNKHINISTFLAPLFIAGVYLTTGAQVESDATLEILPEKWHIDEGLESTGTFPICDWWNNIDDQLLDSLIDLGISNNYNLEMAAHRIAVAQNTVRSTMSSYYPTIRFDASWSKNRSSGMTGNTPNVAMVGSYWSLGASFSWEIDLFGKITSQVKQQKALYRATKTEYDGTMLALSANIAKDYIQLRVWQSQLEVALEHTQSQARVVKITEDRLECELGNMLDVTQARELYYSTKASIPKLENSIHTMINAIAVLLGVNPDEVYPILASKAPLPDFHAIIPIGAPADLLRRRPDIVKAENQLASYAEALGIAKKDFLPTLTLNGSIGTSAHKADDMFGKQSFSYAIMPTLSWTLFDGLDRKYKIAIAREQLKMAFDNYNLTVLNAVSDVDNALSSYKAALLYINAMEKVLEQSNKSFTLSLDLYKSNLTQFSNVVDAQMNVLENQNSLIVARGEALTNVVELFEAIGGGYTCN